MCVEILAAGFEIKDNTKTNVICQFDPPVDLWQKSVMKSGISREVLSAPTGIVTVQNTDTCPRETQYSSGQSVPSSVTFNCSDSSQTAVPSKTEHTPVVAHPRNREGQSTLLPLSDSRFFILTSFLVHLFGNLHYLLLLQNVGKNNSHIKMRDTLFVSGAT